MALFKQFKSARLCGPEGYKIPKVVLSYSVFDGSGPWFCRIHEDDWENSIDRDDYGFRESYGKTKWQAYRRAMNNPLTKIGE